MRDVQRQKAYDWENGLVEPYVDRLAPQGVTALVDRVCREFSVRRPEVRFSGRKHRGSAYCTYAGHALVFGTSKRWWTKESATVCSASLVLHEMAHAMAPRRERHGRIWLGIYVMLLDHYGLRSRSSMERELADLRFAYLPLFPRTWRQVVQRLETLAA